MLFRSKNMTVMIYMVGSDLESTSGNASVDLAEMAESMADTRHNNIIVYAGGASAWQIDGLSAYEDSILKVSSGNVYVVDTLKAANMGEADTLSSFINYCYDNYDSDSYSLILWDHGGAVARFDVFPLTFYDGKCVIEIQIGRASCRERV